MRRELGERRRAMRAALKSRRRALQAELRARRGKLPKTSASKWRRRILMALIILLLLLLHLCTEEPPPQVGKPTPPAPLVFGPPSPPPAPTPPPIRRRLEKRERPEYTSAPPRKKPWLDAYRLQVAGRSVVLATCFEGVERPGAVRWVASVDVKTGQVAEHELEPVANGVVLTQAQKKCLVEALSKPYRLEASDPSSTPERVAMVLEF